MGKEIQSAWRRIDTREAGDGKERCDRRGGGGSIRMCDGGNQRMYDRHGGGSIQGMHSKEGDTIGAVRITFQDTISNNNNNNNRGINVKLTV